MYGSLGLGNRFGKQGAASGAGSGSVSASTASTSTLAHASFNLLLALTN